ncbi:hypothetical protein [Sinorhizobium meliloti]|uniref:hypothetical protein n=1 Tax=Rhizobium meliloti TaxID=382 RepID=UPI00299D5208
MPADLGTVRQRLVAFDAGIAAAPLAVETHPVGRGFVRGNLAAQLLERIGLIAVKPDLFEIYIGKGHGSSIGKLAY